MDVVASGTAGKLKVSSLLFPLICNLHNYCLKQNTISNHHTILLCQWCSEFRELPKKLKFIMAPNFHSKVFSSQVYSKNMNMHVLLSPRFVNWSVDSCSVNGIDRKSEGMWTSFTVLSVTSFLSQSSSPGLASCSNHPISHHMHLYFVLQQFYIKDNVFICVLAHRL